MTRRRSCSGQEISPIATASTHHRHSRRRPPFFVARIAPARPCGCDDWSLGLRDNYVVCLTAYKARRLGEGRTAHCHLIPNAQLRATVVSMK